MISKQCKYFYYTHRIEPHSSVKPIAPAELINTIKSKNIWSIAIFGNYIILAARTNYCIQFSPETAEILWGINQDCRKIINSYIGHNCTDIAEMRTHLMAKILGDT